MKIQQKDYFHGAALTQIVEHESFKALNKADLKYGHYKINHDIRLMVKISTNANDSWQFTVNENDLLTINEDIDSGDDFYLCLVCGLSTICLLDKSQIKQLVDLAAYEQQWIKVESKDGGSLRVRSKIIDLNRVIPHNAFPNNLFK